MFGAVHLLQVILDSWGGSVRGENLADTNAVPPTRERQKQNKDLGFLGPAGLTSEILMGNPIESKEQGGHRVSEG